MIISKPKLIFGIIALAVLVGASGWLLGPGRLNYRQLKEQRALVAAQTSFAKGDYRNASLSAQVVLQLNATNAAACELIADLAELENSPMTLDWRKKAAESLPSVENKLALAQAALRHQSPPYPLATQILETLLPTATNVAKFHAVCAERAVALRQFGEAEARYAAAAKLAPTNRLYVLNQAQMGLSATNAAKLEAARTCLRSFLTDSNFATSAFRGLINDRLTHDDLSAARTLSEQLLRRPQATIDDRLQHLAILKGQRDSNFQVQLAAIQKNAGTNPLAVVKTALWMQANQLSRETIGWLAGLSASLRNQPMVAMIQAVALEATGDWAALRDFCKRGDWAERDCLRLAFLSHGWAQLGEPAVASGNWNAAVNKAGNRYGALLGLLDLTGRWGLAVERNDMFWLLLQKFPRERWISQLLEKQCVDTGDTAGLGRIYQQLATTFPGTPQFQNDFAYTSLLLKKNRTEAEALAVKLHKQFPTNASIASTHAFALHLRGRHAEALAVMQQLPAEEQKQPALALHYGIILLAANQPAAARPYLDIARKATGLLPEEKSLLELADSGQ